MSPSTAEEKPRRWSFSFNADSEKIENKISFDRRFEGEMTGDCLYYTSGAQGRTLSETIIFLDEKAAKLAVLTTFFDVKGKFTHQELRDAKNQLILDDKSLATKPSAPKITVKNSGLTVESEAKNGFLTRRVLTLDTPLWKGTLVSLYDERGRHFSETTLEKTGEKNAVSYQYGAQGLEKFIVTKPDEPDDAISTIKRDEKGLLGEVRMTQNGQLMMAALNLRDAQNKLTATRTRYYQAGALEGMVDMKFKDDKMTVIEYDEKEQIQKRRVFSAVFQKPNLPLTEEKFEEGKLLSLIDFDEKGAPKTMTQFKSDGSVEWKREFDEDGVLKPRAP